MEERSNEQFLSASPHEIKCQILAFGSVKHILQGSTQKRSGNQIYKDLYRISILAVLVDLQLNRLRVMMGPVGFDTLYTFAPPKMELQDLQMSLVLPTSSSPTAHTAST